MDAFLLIIFAGTPADAAEVIESEKITNMIPIANKQLRRKLDPTIFARGR